MPDVGIRARDSAHVQRDDQPARAHVDLLRDVVAPFWNAAPPPHRFTSGRYPTCDDPHSYMDEATWHFWARCRLADAKFWLISLLLRVLGYAAVSAKVWSGWQARALSRPCCQEPVRIFFGGIMVRAA